jgi:peroxiredoxin Q/BCP
MGNVLKVGDKIPQFETILQDESSFSDASLKDQKSIIFFYGSDDTPTCTKEACSVRDHFDTFSKAGYKVYGISRDSAKKHQKFIAKYDLQYPLIVDEDTSIMRKFGYFGPKIFMGKEVEGIYRTTIVIDEKGHISHIIDDVKSAEHGEQIKVALGL